MNVTLVISPESRDSSIPTAVTPREFDAVDRFATALSSTGTLNVSTFEGPVRSAPTNGFLILFGSAELRDNPDAARRSVLINADRSSIRDQIEVYKLVGAIEKHRYFCWRTQQGNETGSGVIGRKDLAEQLGARIIPGPYSTDNYGWLSSDRFQDLPSLLAAYLVAYRL